MGNEIWPAGSSWARSESRLLAICPFAPGVSKGIGKLWGRLQSPIERWWFISFDLLRVKPLRDGFPVFGVTLAGSRPGGRPPFLLRQERRQRRRPGFTGRPSADCPALLPAGGRRGTRPSGSNSRAGLPRLLLRCSAGRNGLFGCTEPLRNLSRALAAEHLHFRSPLARRLEGSAGGKRAAHV